jgi:TonB family protein
VWRSAGSILALADSPTPEAYFDEVRRVIQARMVYPGEAARRGKSGRVALWFEVAKNGSVRCISIERSSGVAILDRAAIDTVRDTTLPPVPGGLGDSVSIRANFSYVLEAPTTTPAPP